MSVFTPEARILEIARGILFGAILPSLLGGN